LSIAPSFALAALQASRTSEARCESVELSADELLAGPAHDVMATPGLAGTGGLETSALALGQARVAIAALADEAGARGDPLPPVHSLGHSWTRLARMFLAAASGQPDTPTAAEIRRQANSLVLKATQAYLTARKGTGFLRTDPAQRWARQALFFLVWSCPSPVARATIQDLANLCAT
jgi:hypothetical protein